MIKTTSILIGLAVATAAPSAWAQDDIFGDDQTDGDGTTDPMSDGSGDTSSDNTADTSAEATTTSGGVARSSGTLGVGFTATTTGVTAVEAEYWLSPSLLISALGGAVIFAGDLDGTFLQIGGGALLVMKDRGQAALMVGGRFLLGYASVGDASATSIRIEAPLRLQLALHEQVSAHVEGGAAIDIGDQAAFGGDPNETFGIGIGTANLFGGAGLTFYFK